MQFEYNKSFNFTEIGNWPNEKYNFSPISENIEPISKPIYLYFPVFGNPSVDYGIYSKNPLIDYEYGSIYKDHQPFKNKITLNLFSNTVPLSFYYTPIHRELYPYSIFNVFGIDSDETTKGFFLNPKTLFFKPVYTEKSDIGWRISLTTILLGTNPIYFHSNEFIADALKIYKLDREKYDLKTETEIPKNLIFKYDVKGCEKYFNKGIINFTDTFNPSSYQITLEETGTHIKPNSIYITNKHYLIENNANIGEISYYNNEDNDFFNYNGTNYNFNNDNDYQKYELFKNPLDSDDIWLSLKLSPSTTYLEYDCNLEKVKGVVDTSLGIKYIADSDKIKNTNENVEDTILIFEDNGNIQDINQEFSSENSGNILLDLKYPPHYYNINLKYKAYTDFYNLSGILTFEDNDTDTLLQKIFDYFDSPIFIDDRYSKFAYSLIAIDDSFYKSTGVLLSSISSYSNYNINNITNLTAYSLEELKTNLTSICSIFDNILYTEIDNDIYKTKGIKLSGIPVFSGYNYITGSTLEELSANILNFGIPVYVITNTTNSSDLYKSSGTYNTSVNYYNDTFVNEVSSYETVSYLLNTILVTATEIPQLTSLIYNLGEPYINYAEITNSIYHQNEYVSTGIVLSGDWVCIDTQTATGSNYYELTASADSFGGIYSLYSTITSKINFLNDFKTTGAYFDGIVYKNQLSSFEFQEATPTTYYNSISTYDLRVNAIFNVSVSSYDETLIQDTYLYNTISVYNIDSKIYENFVEGYSFNYDLTSKVIDYSTDFVKISTYLFSDYHLSMLDLETYGIFDYIKYEFLDVSNTLKPFLSCYYSEEKIPYNIYDLDWVSATSGCVLYIEYPNTTFGEVSFNIVPKLSTQNGILDSYFKTKITLAKNLTNNDLYGSNKLILNKKNEKSNLIEIELVDLYDDLTGNNTSWTFEPDIKNVVMYVKNPETDEIQYIQKNESIVYNKNYTSIVYLSGYTNNELKIIAYSEKYNKTVDLNTNLELFDIYEDSQPIIYPIIPLDNLNKIRTIDLAVYLQTQETLNEFSDEFSMYWLWEYGDLTDSTIQPITAIKNDGRLYSSGETETIQSISALRFFINPNQNYSSIENTIKIKAYILNEKKYFTPEYTFTVDDYPIDSLYSLNIESYYDNYPDVPIHNTTISPFFTRPLNDFSVYRFSIDSSETSIFKFLDNYENITWEFYDNLGFYQKITGVDTVDHYEIYNSLDWNLNFVKLKIENLKLPNWNTPHTFTKILTIKSLTETEFYNPLKVIFYPEFYWPTHSSNIVFSNEDNFIYALTPSTYENKKSETYSFYVSADKNFNTYEYSTGDVLNTPTGKIVLPESNQIKSYNGISISVSAFDDIYFPKQNGIVYKIATETELLDYYMDNLVFTTLPFESEVDFYIDNFTKSPKILPFDTFNFTFSSIFSSVNIKDNRILIVDQFILPNYKNSPIKIVDDNSTVVYTLSTIYWVATKEIEAKTGRYNIFELNLGNPLEILTISNKSIETLYLTAEARLKKTIPYETFENYPSYEDKELWKIVDETLEAKELDYAFIADILGNIE